jgi:cytoskeleton protein RodZ
MGSPMELERASDFGARLKRLREEKGVALRDIATATKISVSALEALERNDISRLPGGIFSRGFVRAYAEEIGADPEVIVREFKARFPHDAADDDSPYGTTHDEESDAGAGGARIAVVIVILVPLVVIIVWSLL